MIEDIVKVPISHFNKLMTACCEMHGCIKNPEECDCLNSVNEDDNEQEL